MKEVFDFAKGKLSYENFAAAVDAKPEIWAFLQELVPKDIADENCDYRKKYGVSQNFVTNGYDIEETLTAFGFDDIGTKIDVCRLIPNLVEYNYPEIKVKRLDPFAKVAKTPLEKMKLDYLGGEEADAIVDAILENENLSDKEKKALLKEKFHIAPRKYPHWVQEPEWPCQGAEPMKFIEEKSEGDKFEYIFENVETGEKCTVVQLA